MPGDGPYVEVVRPGLVVIRGLLSRAEEEAMVAQFLELGNHPADGFYETVATTTINEEDGTETRTHRKQLNSTPTRGRIYHELSFFGEDVSTWMLETSAKAVKLAQERDPFMPSVVPDHALLLYYATQKGMGEHRDDGENDGQGDAPIISFNFGKSILFRVRMSKNEDKTDIPLHSGDVVLFGGPSRLAYHSVTIARSSEGASPHPDLMANRMNLTLRYAPNVAGREDEFRTFKPASLFGRLKKEKEETAG